MGTQTGPRYTRRRARGTRRTVYRPGGSSPPVHISSQKRNLRAPRPQMHQIRCMWQQAHRIQNMWAVLRVMACSQNTCSGHCTTALLRMRFIAYMRLLVSSAHPHSMLVRPKAHLKASSDRHELRRFTTWTGSELMRFIAYMPLLVSSGPPTQCLSGQGNVL